MAITRSADRSKAEKVSTARKGKDVLKQSGVKKAPKSAKRIQIQNVAVPSKIVFKKPAVIAADDSLSQLPYDCLGSVLTLLNSDDLDKLTAASQTMHSLAEHARPRAAKTRASKFHLSQRYPGRVIASIALPVNNGGLRDDRGYSLTIDRDSPNMSRLFKKTNLKELAKYAFRSQVKLHKIAPVDRSIMENLIIRLGRFRFDVCTFEAIAINDDFIEDFKGIASSKFSKLRFKECAFHNKFKKERRERFLSFLLALKPGKLDLHFPRKDEADIFDETFIRRYADSVSNPRLILPKGKQITHVTRDLLSVLVRFAELRVMTFVLTPDQVIDMILERLQMSVDVETVQVSESSPDIVTMWSLPVTGFFDAASMNRIDRTRYTVRTSDASNPNIIKRRHANIQAEFRTWTYNYPVFRYETTVSFMKW